MPRSHRSPLDARGTADAVAPVPLRSPARGPIRGGLVSIETPLDVLARLSAMDRDDRGIHSDTLGIMTDYDEAPQDRRRHRRHRT